MRISTLKPGATCKASSSRSSCASCTATSNARDRHQRWRAARRYHRPTRGQLADPLADLGRGRPHRRAGDRPELLAVPLDVAPALADASRLWLHSESPSTISTCRRWRRCCERTTGRRRRRRVSACSWPGSGTIGVLKRRRPGRSRVFGAGFQLFRHDNPGSLTRGDFRASSTPSYSER